MEWVGVDFAATREEVSMFRFPIPGAAFSVLALACLVGMAPEASAQPAFTLQGFVDQNTTTPAPMVQVVLLDAASQRPLATAQTNFFGKYSFKALPPGEYLLRSGDQTLAWGTASQGGSSGNWTVSGDAQRGTIHLVYKNGRSSTLRYRQFGDPGCLEVDGSKLCRTSRSCD